MSARGLFPLARCIPVLHAMPAEAQMLPFRAPTHHMLTVLPLPCSAHAALPLAPALPVRSATLRAHAASRASPSHKSASCVACAEACLHLPRGMHAALGLWPQARARAYQPRPDGGLPVVAQPKHAPRPHRNRWVRALLRVRLQLGSAAQADALPPRICSRG